MIYGANGGSPGVWLAPRRRRPRRGTGVALILIGVAAGGALAYFAGDPILDRATRVRRVEIQVEGPGVVTTEEVARILDLPAVFSWRDLNPPVLVARLRAEPRVAAARIEYVWFQRLVVSVEERAAVGMIVGPGGRVLEVATDGLLLEPRGDDVADLPLLTWDDFLLREVPEAGAILDLPGAPDLTDLLRQLQIAQPGLWRASPRRISAPTGPTRSSGTRRRRSSGAAGAWEAPACRPGPPSWKTCAGAGRRTWSSTCASAIRSWCAGRRPRPRPRRASSGRKEAPSWHPRTSSPASTWEPRRFAR